MARVFNPGSIATRIVASVGEFYAIQVPRLWTSGGGKTAVQLAQ
jgi:hypothetical protein